jgi:hypothetical protein
VVIAEQLPYNQKLARGNSNTVFLYEHSQNGIKIVTGTGAGDGGAKLTPACDREDAGSGSERRPHHPLLSSLQ